MIDLHLSADQTVELASQLHHAALLAALHAAYRQAQATGRAVLVSYSQPVAQCEPLALFASADEVLPATAFYWEHPTNQRAIAGFGETALITSADIIGASEQWRRLVEQALIRHAPDTGNAYPAALMGPLCFGGFAFDPVAPRSALWDGFPNGLLILPHLLVGTDGTSTYLTVNAQIQTEQDIAHEMTHLKQTLAQFDQAKKQLHAGEQLAQPEQLTTRNLQTKTAWNQMVQDATQAIQHGAYSKVALARSIEAQASAPFVVSATLNILRARYANAYIFALRRGQRTFLGATPERLAQVSNGRVETMALASSAPRGTSSEEDAALSQVMLSQSKTQSEHHIVVTMIREALAPLTTSLTTPEQPQLLKLPNVQHLLTPISGELLPGVTVLDVVAALHPTPAVAGEPRAAALAAIRQSEQLDRGWYAGPIGWVGADGSGEFSVALRSALVEGSRAALFAGCGIVAGSDPQAEYEESGWKLQVMLQSLAGKDQ